jgi:transcriptional regulator with XRE-family HTH domain
MKLDAASFWKRTNSLIRAQKTKQEAIAAKCNISYQTFRGWVTRKTFPAGDETYLIAQALGTTVEFLIIGNNPKPLTADETFDEIQALIDKYRKNTGGLIRRKP